MATNLFGLSEELWLLLDRLGTLAGLIASLVALAGGLWGFFKREEIRRWLTLNRFRNVGVELGEARHWQSIIFTVSHEELPMWVIDHVKPFHVGLLATGQSRPAALKIKQGAERRGIQVHGPLCIDNPDDPGQSRDKTRELLESLREAGAEQYAVDITGGKTPMSLGAFMAAEEAGASTLYVACDFDSALNRPNIRTARLQCISKPE